MSPEARAVAHAPNHALVVGRDELAVSPDYSTGGVDRDQRAPHGSAPGLCAALGDPDVGEHLEVAGSFGDRADLRLEDARVGLRSLPGKFDFAFMDGIKGQYADYFEALLPLLDDRAVLVVDNVLMSGAVASGERSERLSVARAFNERLLTHPEFTATLTPVGDGVLIAVKHR